MQPGQELHILHMHSECESLVLAYLFIVPMTPDCQPSAIFDI